MKQFEKEYGFGDSTEDSVFNYGVSPYWTSGQPYDPDYNLSTMETHELMTIDAISLLCDTGYFITKDAAQALVLTLFIAKASALPDRQISGVGMLYAGHFYNPETEKSFLPVSSTARSNMKKNYNAAKDKFQTSDGKNIESQSFQDALEDLGKMLHFVQDACEPHHSSNEIALLGIKTPHSEFESYVFKNYEECSKNYGWDCNEYERCLTQSKDDISMIVHRAAIASHVFIDTVNDLEHQEQWRNTGGICASKSILMSAIALRIAFENNGVLVKL